MKKLIFILIAVLFIVLSVGYTQTTYYANQVTITWDAPTTYENGDLLPVDLDIYYDVFIREKGGEQIYLGEILSPPYTVTFPAPNRKYDIGVLAKYQLEGNWFYSVVNWSIDDILNTEGWDVGFFVPASPPTNLRIE